MSAGRSRRNLRHSSHASDCAQVVRRPKLDRIQRFGVAAVVGGTHVDRGLDAAHLALDLGNRACGHIADGARRLSCSCCNDLRIGDRNRPRRPSPNVKVPLPGSSRKCVSLRAGFEEVSDPVQISLAPADVTASSRSGSLVSGSISTGDFGRVNVWAGLPWTGPALLQPRCCLRHRHRVETDRIHAPGCGSSP